MSLWVMKVLMVFYIVLAISCWVERKNNFVTYFVGALILTWGLYREMVKG